jgi:O-antigen/teichoic acid export membrane protein
MRRSEAHEGMSARPAIPDPLLAAPADLPPEPLPMVEFRQQMGHISRQSSVYFAGTIFTAAAGYFFKVYLARVLGAEALGIYALGMTVAGFFGIFNALGLPQSAVRFVAKYAASQRWKDLAGFIQRSTAIMLGLNLLLAMLMIAVGPRIATRFYHAPALVRYLPLFALIMLLGALTFFLGQVLAGYKDVTRRTIITSFIANPLNMAIAILLISLGAGLWGYIFAQVASATAVLVMLLVVVWNMTPAPARVPFYATSSLEPEVISFSVTAFGVGFLEFLMGQADKILIGFFLNARSVGIYAVAMAIVAFIPVLLQSVNQIFSPVISDLHTRGQGELLGRMFQTLTKWILAFTVPLAVVVMIQARPMMGIFGRDFEIGWPILVIGTLGQLVNCGVGSVGYLLLMSGNQQRLIKVQAFAAAFMVLANLILIPRLGITGAALAAALTVVLSNAWYLREVRQALGMSPYNRSYWRLVPAISGSIAVAFLLRALLGGLKPAWLSIIISLIVVYVVFITIIMISGVKDEDRVLANAVWARVRGRFDAGRSRNVAVSSSIPKQQSAPQSDVETAQGPPPIFIVGPSRSGTTLLSRMLDAHTSLAIFPETWCYVVLDRLGCYEDFKNRWQYILFLNQVWDALRQYKDEAARVLAEEAAKRPSYSGPVRPVLQSFGRAYAAARGATQWGEKTPGHVLWLPQIRSLFPEAKILVCLRDPLDVVASYDERWGGGRAETEYLMRASAQVRHYLHRLLQEPAFPVDQILTVRYESLTTYPQEVLQEICQFLEIQFEPNMLEFYRNHANVERDTPDGQYHHLLAQPATSERVGRYRSVFSPSQIALIGRCLGDEVRQLGYATPSTETATFTTEESAALAQGLKLYEEMRSGAIRSRLRRKERLRLNTYRLLGRPLAAIPWKRLALTSKDWEARAQQSIFSGEN